MIQIKSEKACDISRKILDRFSEKVSPLIVSCDRSQGRNLEESHRLSAKSQAYNHSIQILTGVIEEVMSE